MAIHVDIKNDTICLDGEAIVEIGHCYVMLHKPSGVVSATEDNVHPTAIDSLFHDAHFVGDKTDLVRLRRATLQIVGRLDKDTTGLLLLTNDGDWNHRLCSPQHHFSKRYIATLAEPLNADIQEQFAKGILLNGETKPTQAATLEQCDTHRARVTINEGRYHQIKRMFAACGNHVVNLHREQVGNIKLDPSMAPGDFRCLRADEVALT